MTNLTTRQRLGHHDSELYLDDRHLIGRVGSIDGTNVLNVGNVFLTAADVRAIADLLDPPKPTPLRCPRCHSARWVAVSHNGGLTRFPQCVPCGRTYGEPLDGL